MHILMTGDLYQLRAIGGHPVYTTLNLIGLAKNGRKIWLAINEYCELIENYRIRNDTTSVLQEFLRGAPRVKLMMIYCIKSIRDSYYQEQKQ